MYQPDSLERLRKAAEAAVIDGKPFEVELKIIRSDGEIRHCFGRGYAETSSAGVVTRLYGSLQDVTENKLAEELREQIERIVQHDLRTPASNAIHIARILREEANLTGIHGQLLELFEQAGEHMLDTLNASLSIYKIEMGQYSSQPESIDCLALIQGLIRTTSQLPQFAGIHVEVRINDQFPSQDSRCPCLGQPNLLRLALQNLLNNALEVSSPGTAVVVSLYSDTDCRIEITNKGVIPLEVRESFFDKFVTSGKQTGTGLGTYSAKMMVKAQGGDITMTTSDQDNNTVLTVHLPC